MFYTNVNIYGNTVYTRGFDDDGPFIRKQNYQPSLWIASNEPSHFKNIHNENLKPRTFPDIRSARDFVKSADGLYPVYGSTKFESSFIHEFFGDITPEPEKIRIASIDIEVDTGTSKYKPNHMIKVRKAQ